MIRLKELGKNNTVELFLLNWALGQKDFGRNDGYRSKLIDYIAKIGSSLDTDALIWYLVFSTSLKKG